MVVMLVAMLATVNAQQRTDTTFAVQPGSRLELNDVAGDVKVQAWDKPSIRISAERGSRDYLDITVSAVAIQVRARSRRGTPATVNYDIWVPASTPVDVSGPEADITIDGLKADISAETVEGAIDVHGATGYVSLKSNEGAITLENASGHVQVNNVEGDIQLTSVSGQVTVETVNGDITLEGVDADHLEANTVDGTIKFRGAIKDGGDYQMATHDGDLDVTVPATTNATVSVATHDGDFEATFPLTIDKKGRSKRFSFTLGSGSAKMELESFDGTITLNKGTTAHRRD